MTRGSAAGPSRAGTSARAVRVLDPDAEPGFFEGPLGEGMIRIAREKGIVDVALVPIRDFAADRYGTTDDSPYGRRRGMVMKADTIVAAHENAKATARGREPDARDDARRAGRSTQDWARELAAETAPGRGLRPVQGDRRARDPAPRARKRSRSEITCCRAARPRRWSFSTR